MHSFFLLFLLPNYHTWGTGRELTVTLFWKQGYFVFILCRSRAVVEYFRTTLLTRNKSVSFYILRHIPIFLKFKGNKKIHLFSLLYIYINLYLLFIIHYVCIYIANAFMINIFKYIFCTSRQYLHGILK